MGRGRNLDGLDEVLNNLNKEIQGIKGRSLRGLWKAGLFIQGEAQRELRESVVTGNLRASGYTRKKGELVRLDASQIRPTMNARDPVGDPPAAVELGFTALYAIYVHENLEGSRSPKFLEGPLKRHVRKIIQIVRDDAKIR